MVEPYPRHSDVIVLGCCYEGIVFLQKSTRKSQLQVPPAMTYTGNNILVIVS